MFPNKKNSSPLSLPKFRSAIINKHRGVTPIERIENKRTYCKVMGDSSVLLHWTIKNENVPSLPFMYPLQPTHILISKINPSSIVANIENCLRKLSITAKFDNEKVKAHAQTKNQMEFSISLFSNPLQKDSNCNTIVEINRTNSAEFGFYNIVCAIFQSAKGDSYDVSEIYQSSSSKRRKICDFLPVLQPDEEVFYLALQRANNLLNKDRCDANRLGIESMVYLTNSQHTFEGVAFSAAHSVLCENDDKTFEDLQTKIYNLVVYGTMNEGEYDENAIQDQFLSKHNSKMRSCALDVLLNSLETMKSSNKSSSLDNICAELWFGEDLLYVLLDDLKGASYVPHGAHVAHVAMKCLHLMISNSSEFRARIQKMGDLVKNIVENALIAGQTSHDLLAKESEFCISALKCV